MNYIRSHERGQVMVMLVLGLIGLLALTALAIDGGNVFSDRRNAQNAVDNAAYAAAYAWTRGANYQTAGDGIINKNGYTSGGNGLWTYDTTLIQCANESDGIVIDVTLNTTVQTYFASIVGWNQLHNKVVAESRGCKYGKRVPLFGNSAVYSTKTTNCTAGFSSAGIGIGGTGKVDIYGGDIGQASIYPSCVNFNGSNFDLTFHQCGNLTTAAPPSPGINPPIQSDQMTWPDGCGQVVYNGMFNPPPPNLGITCTQDSSLANNTTLTPGNYPGSNFHGQSSHRFPPSGVTTLLPGTYCVNADFILNGGVVLTGSEVTIVMNGTNKIDFAGGAQPTITAPSSGNYKGLLIYAPPGNTSVFNIDGNSSTLMQGTILAQDANCNYNGTGEIQKQTLQIICYTVQISGANDTALQYDPNYVFTWPDPPTVEMLK